MRICDKVRRETDMELWKTKLVSSMEKVFPMKEPSGEGAERKMAGLKGETLSFQIASWWGGEAREFAQVRTRAPEGISVRVRSVSLVPCVYTCNRDRDEDYLVTEPGLYPDLLEEIGHFGFKLMRGIWCSLWVDLEIGEEARGGGEIRIVLENGQQTIEESVSLEVLDAAAMPLSIPHTEWFHSDCLADYYGVEVFSERHWEIMENFVKTAVKRGCNTILTPIFTPPLDTEKGGERTTVQLIDVSVKGKTYEFSYGKFNRWVDMCDRCGIQYFEMSHLFSQWGAVYCPKIIGCRNGREEKLFGWHTRADSGEYAEFLDEFLRSFAAHIEKLGIGERCFFHVSDEPHLDQLDSYRTARSLIQERLKGYRIIDALSDYAFYETGAVEEPICANDMIHTFLEKRPGRLWTYYCTSQGMDVSNRYIAVSGYRTRILGIQLYKYDIDGFLHWGYNFYNSQYSRYPVDPYRCTDADGAFCAGDPFLVYPGKDGRPEESIRIMLMYEAMTDFMALKYLESITDRETALGCLGEEGEWLDFRNYPRSISYVTQVRRRVNEAIRRAL